MTSSDGVLICRDCGAEFDFSEDERQAMAVEGHVHPPSRCPDCRLARKRRQAESGTRVVGPGFRELRETRTLIACSSCGAAAVVPFAARRDRAVYCSPCFQRRRLGAADR